MLKALLNVLLWLLFTYPLSLFFSGQNLPRARLQVIAYLGSSLLGHQKAEWRPRANDISCAVGRAQTRESAPQPRFPTLPLTSTQCRDIANNHRELRRLGITHVLNASHSRWRGTHEAYEGLGIRYLGVEAHDSPAFDMSIHFQTAADFIHRALSLPGGRRGSREGRDSGH